MHDLLFYQFLDLVANIKQIDSLFDDSKGPAVIEHLFPVLVQIFNFGKDLFKFRKVHLAVGVRLLFVNYQDLGPRLLVILCGNAVPHLLLLQVLLLVLEVLKLQVLLIVLAHRIRLTLVVVRVLELILNLLEVLVVDILGYSL